MSEQQAKRRQFCRLDFFVFFEFRVLESGLQELVKLEMYQVLPLLREGTVLNPFCPLILSSLQLLNRLSCSFQVVAGQDLLIYVLSTCFVDKETIRIPSAPSTASGKTEFFLCVCVCVLRSLNGPKDQKILKPRFSFSPRSVFSSLQFSLFSKNNYVMLYMVGLQKKDGKLRKKLIYTWKKGSYMIQNEILLILLLMKEL